MICLPYGGLEYLIESLTCIQVILCGTIN